MSTSSNQSQNNPPRPRNDEGDHETNNRLGDETDPGDGPSTDTDTHSGVINK